jgi:hypothetical protein
LYSLFKNKLDSVTRAQVSAKKLFYRVCLVYRNAWVKP